MERILVRAGVALVAASACVAFSAVSLGAEDRPGSLSRTADFGVWGDGPSEGIGAITTVVLEPSTIEVDDDGGTFLTYNFPDGSTMVRITPPAGFDPLNADESTLWTYGFSAAPTEKEDYAAWYDAMDAYHSTPESANSAEFSYGGDGFARDVYHNWAGYIAGQTNVQAHTYVAVKGNQVVPTNSSSCGGDPTHSVGFWIGMGGTGGNYPDDNLVQQGFACGKSQLGSVTTYHPFYQFANTDQTANKFCGIGSSWTVSAGDVIYQNMSFQTSTNRAFFYLEDQTTGLAQPCNFQPPAGWHWNLNTAEWIGESTLGNPANFGSVHFTNTRAQLYSNSSWVTLGSQPYIREYQGWKYIDGHIYKCIDSSALDAGGAGFTLTWTHPTCDEPPPPP